MAWYLQGSAERDEIERSFSTQCLGFPTYLLRIIRSYFHDRILEYDTDDGSQKYTVMDDVPQGSVLGLTLRNAKYDGIIKMELPMNATLVGKADDVVTVVTEMMWNSLQRGDPED